MKPKKWNALTSKERVISISNAIKVVMVGGYKR